ncbi:hypothetical protein [Ralstonia sp.]|uniref:hypothetical protein n=1 Tax=Ralstonia sp. TaxID=54061 RepID=UPI0031CE4AE1
MPSLSSGPGPVRFQALQAVYRSLGPPVVFHDNLARLAGSVKAGLMLSQALYWTARGPDIVANDGWFYKTRHEWQKQTGMSRTEQETARRILRELGVFEERLIGMPRRMWFRIQLERLGEQLASLDVNRRRLPPAAPDDVAARPLSLRTLRAGEQWVRQLLGPIQWFHREFATLTGSVTSALFLSCALTQFFKLARRQEQVRGMTLSQPEWSRLSGMDRTQLQNARRTLREAGVIEELRQGVPPVVVLLLNLDSVMNGLCRRTCLREPVKTAPRKPCDRPARVSAQSAQSRSSEGPVAASSLPDLGILSAETVQISRQNAWQSAGGKRANQSAGNVRNIYTKLTTTIKLQRQQPRAHASADAGVPAFGGGVVLPDLDTDATGNLASSALRLLAQWSATDAARQAIADELIGAIRFKPGGVHNPLGYLHAMIAAAQRGAFTPAYGPRIRAAREAQHRVVIANAAAEHALHAAIAHKPADPVTARPGIPARSTTGAAHLSQLLALVRGRTKS